MVLICLILELKRMRLIVAEHTYIQLLPVERKCRSRELHVRRDLESRTVIVKDLDPLELSLGT